MATTKINLKKLKEKDFLPLIDATKAAHPYFNVNEQIFIDMLALVKEVPCFLDRKPTPLSSSWVYMLSVLGNPQIDYETFIFFLVAVKANLGVRRIGLHRRDGATRSTFKVFPAAVSGIWEEFAVHSINDVTEIELSLRAFPPTKVETANIQSCANILLRKYELYVKAMELYQRHKRDNKSYAQARSEIPSLTNNEYMRCLHILADMGLFEFRKTLRLPSKILTVDNANYVKAEAKRLNKTNSFVINRMIDAYREKHQGKKMPSE